MSFSKFDAARLYKKLRALEPNVSGALGTPPSGSAVGAVGDVVLVTGAGTTTDVLDARITSTTFMEIAPADLYGSAEKGAGNIFWSSPADGIMRITHTASTKTRTFKYLLMFALALLLATASFGQVIREDGTPLEVQPALNFGPGILCTDAVTFTDCDVFSFGAGGDVMLVSEWATGAAPYGIGAPYVDYAQVAYAAEYIDTGLDGLPQFFCQYTGIPGADFCEFDVEQDGTYDLRVSAGFINYSGFLYLDRWVVSSGGTLSTSTCVQRTNDRLFEDKDCDGLAGLPEATGVTGTTNSEGLLTDAQRRLGATLTTNGATDATGVLVSGLTIDLDFVGTYVIDYTINSQSSAVGNGLTYGVNYNAALTSMFCHRTFVSTGVTCPAVAPFPGPFPVPAIPACGATGVIDNVAATNAGQLVEGYASNAACAAPCAAPTLGPNTGVAVANATNLEHIRCHLVTTVAGDLTFYYASEANGVPVSLMLNTTVRAHMHP